ncbi:MAG: phosphate uptake regulator PhoU [Candidatus Bathyarchaeia archaeon]
MERRIMSLGRSSMVISLPKNWMTLNELNKGDVVSYAIQRDRSLVVYPGAEKKSPPKETTIKIGSNEDEALIIQKIIGSFLNGYSGITLIAEKILSVPQRKAIRYIAGRLYMRIMESDSRGVYLQTLTDESKASLDQAVQRMHLISYSMCEDVFTALKTNDISLAKSVLSLDDDVDQFHFLILRILREAAQSPVLANELRLDPVDCMDYQYLSVLIEHAADYVADIAKHIIMIDGIGETIPSNLLELMVDEGTEVVDLYIKAVNAFFQHDLDFSVEIMKQTKRIEKLDQEIANTTFISNKKPELICAVCSIREDIKRLAFYAANIAEVTVNHAFKVST